MMKTSETPKKTAPKKDPTGKPGRKPDQTGAVAGNADSASRTGSDSNEPKAEAGKPGDEIDRIATMTIGELQALYAEVRGEKTRCPNRAWLIKKVMEAAMPVAPGSSVEADAPVAGSAEPALLAGQVGPEAASKPQEAAIGKAAPSPEPVAKTGDTGANSAGTAAAETEAANVASPATPKLSKLGVPALRSLYAEVVGRETQSSNTAYLAWKISAARRGAVPTGPRKATRAEETTFKVLPLRMEADLVDKLDEAWLRLGLRNRMDLFRAALRAYFTGFGEQDLAERFSIAD